MCNRKDLFGWMEILRCIENDTETGNAVKAKKAKEKESG